jgi:hypothetical protein
VEDGMADRTTTPQRTSNTRPRRWVLLLYVALGLFLLWSWQAAYRNSTGHAGVGGHDEREQTLNQLLVEMDGFEANSGVILLGATNRPEVLDPALLRPGRFDRQVVLDALDARGREEVLKVHARNKKLAPDVDLRRIARATPGFSGADLATRNLTGVSSPWITRDSNNRVCISWYKGVSNSDARNNQSPSVESAIVTPDRASWPASRCTGVWSANLAVTTGASRPGPHHPLAIGPTCVGPAVRRRCSTGTVAGSQCRQA